MDKEKLESYIYTFAVQWHAPLPSYPNTKLSLCVCMGRESGHYSISGWIIDSLLFSDWSAPLLQPIIFNFWLDNWNPWTPIGPLSQDYESAVYSIISRIFSNFFLAIVEN